MTTQSNVEALLEKWFKRHSSYANNGIREHYSAASELRLCIGELEAALKADKESFGKAMAWPSRNYPE